LDLGKVKRGGRVILALVPDLMLAVPIEETAKRLGARVETAGSKEAAATRLRSRGIDAVVVDLAIAGLDPAEIAVAAREAGASLIGFYPHVDAALRRKALHAGIEHIYARSRFLRELPAILREALEA
jgi:CheY-like chemotaxis protein